MKIDSQVNKSILGHNKKKILDSHPTLPKIGTSSLILFFYQSYRKNAVNFEEIDIKWTKSQNTFGGLKKIRVWSGSGESWMICFGGPYKYILGFLV